MCNIKFNDHLDYKEFLESVETAKVINEYAFCVDWLTFGECPEVDVDLPIMLSMCTEVLVKRGVEIKYRKWRSIDGL